MKYMSILLEAVRDKPLGFWPLDGTSPFSDLSGYNRASSLVSGTLTRHAPLANGVGDAAIFHNTARGSFTFPTFVKGRERKSFTMEAVVRLITPASATTGEVQILGHADTYDGLVINGTIVSFVTKYTASGESRASYDLELNRAVHVVGVHSFNKNSLYVNGELVAEEDISEYQQVDTYLTDGNTLYAGQSPGTQRIAMSAVAVYNYPVSPESISRHARVARDAPDIDDVPESFGGTLVTPTAQPADIFLEYILDEDDDWESALSVGVAVEDGKLMPITTGSVSQPGTWMGVFPLSAANATSIFGVSINWDGTGAVVETSLDYDTWQTVTRGQFVSSVPSGFNPTNKDLFIRISFPGDIINDTSYIANFTATGYLLGTSTSGDRAITKAGTLNEGRDYSVLDYADGWGTRLTGSGALRIGASDVATTSRTLEMWVRSLEDGTTASALMDARTGSTDTTSPFIVRNSGSSGYTLRGTVYFNGALVSGTPVIRQDEWTLIHVVSTTAFGSVRIGERYDAGSRGKFEIGSIAIYDASLTATQIAAIADTYGGTPPVRAGDNSIIGIAVAPEASDIYAYDWSIQQAG